MSTLVRQHLILGVDSLTIFHLGVLLGSEHGTFCEGGHNKGSARASLQRI